MDKAEFIYNYYKDESIGAKKFRALVSRKFKLTDIEISNIYARINNYQVKKYGKRLGKSDDIEYKTREEFNEISKKLRDERYRRLNGQKEKNS